MWFAITQSAEWTEWGIKNKKKGKLTVWSRRLDDFALIISTTIYIASGKNLDESADITSIYGLKPRLAFAKYGKYRQVASKLCKSLLRNQRNVQLVLTVLTLNRLSPGPNTKPGRIIVASGQ